MGGPEHGKDGKDGKDGKREVTNEERIPLSE